MTVHLGIATRVGRSPLALPSSRGHLRPRQRPRDGVQHGEEAPSLRRGVPAEAVRLAPLAAAELVECGRAQRVALRQTSDVGTDKGRRESRQSKKTARTADVCAQTQPASSIEAPGDPAAYELLLTEAVRALSAQEAQLDELRMRAGTMLSAGGVIAAFLGTATLTIASGLTAKGPDPTPWWSLFLIYVGIITAIVTMVVDSWVFVGLLPARKWTFRVGTKKLLGDYIETAEPATMPELHRSLAWYFAEAEEKNGTDLGDLYERFGWGARLFIANLVIWLIVLSGIVLVRLQA